MKLFRGNVLYLFPPPGFLSSFHLVAHVAHGPLLTLVHVRLIVTVEAS